MADYYLQFSEVIPQLTDDEAAWLTEQLRTVAIIDGVEQIGDDVSEREVSDRATWVGPRFLRGVEDIDASDEPDFSVELRDGKPGDDWGRHLWIYSDCHGNLDQVAELVQQFLKRFRPNDSWIVGYACTCSKPCVGEFGGGAVVVNAESVDWYNGPLLAAEAVAAAASVATSAG